MDLLRLTRSLSAKIILAIGFLIVLGGGITWYVLIKAERQTEKLASLGRLTADVAHEIRNPLTSIGGFAKRLCKIASTEKEKEYADTIRCEVGRLEKILRDLIAFSKEARYHL